MFWVDGLGRIWFNFIVLVVCFKVLVDNLGVVLDYFGFEF